MAPVTWRAEQIFEMAVSAVKRGEFERAADLCVGAIRVKPDHADAFNVRGICHLRLQRPFDALLHFEQALGLDATRHDFWNNRGIALAEVGLWAEAERSYRKSLELHEASEPHIMLGGMYAHLMRLDESEREFKAALAIEPDLQDVHVKLGVIQLSLGKWDEAFSEYEWRWFDTPYPPRPYRLFPKWRGEDICGKTILLYSEQGYGDEIMALRFAHPLHGLGAKVILETRPTMLRLARSMGFPVLALGDEYPPGIDYSCPLLDVPMVLGMMPEDLPAQPSYLRAPGNASHWAERIAGLPKSLNVGLCWSAGRRALQPETEKSAAAKSMKLLQIQPLINVEGVNFISLQSPRERIPSSMRVTDWMEHVDDFGDTADLINHLDLVISVDTSVAHLAGALGKPCWNLVRFNGYWPWMLHAAGSDGPQPTLWYPSMQIYQQAELGDWEPVIMRVRDDLFELVAQQEKQEAA
jgi:Tfp pilus assembly protein PilF